jgi:hypothetical protein
LTPSRDVWPAFTIFVYCTANEKRHGLLDLPPPWRRLGGMGTGVHNLFQDADHQCIIRGADSRIRHRDRTIAPADVRPSSTRQSPESHVRKHQLPNHLADKVRFRTGGRQYEQPERANMLSEHLLPDGVVDKRRIPWRGASWLS